MKPCAFLLISFWLVLITPARCYQHRINVIAHRGASSSAPENTIEAFKLAMEEGADMLELDVRQTRDSQLVVIHDVTIDRTTDGSGRINDFTYDQLKRFDAGSWFQNGRFAQARIPLLQDVVDVLDSTTRLLIEIKEGSDESPGIEQRVLECIEDNRLEARVIIKSFEDGILATVRRTWPALLLLKVYVVHLPVIRMTI